MRREPKEEMDPAQELERLLGKMNKPTKKKTTRKFSKITCGEFGSRTLYSWLSLELIKIGMKSRLRNM